MDICDAIDRPFFEGAGVRLTLSEGMAMAREYRWAAAARSAAGIDGDTTEVDAKALGVRGPRVRRALIISFDFETTGLDPSVDRIVEVGAVAFDLHSHEELATFESLVNPGRPCHPKAFAAHGLDDALLAGRRPTGEIIHEFVHWLRRHRPACLIAHNAGFDIGFFRAELERIGLTLPEYPAECTLALARRKLPQLRSHRLEVVAGYLGLLLDGGHRALADARRCAGIWRLLDGKMAILPRVMAANSAGFVVDPDVRIVDTTIGFTVGEPAADVRPDMVWPDNPF